MRYAFNPKKLKDVREMQNLSLQEVADRLGGGRFRQQISSWEIGKFKPRVDKLANLCTALRVHPSEFFDIIP